MKLSEEIRNHCKIGLEHTEERGMIYNSIWDQFIAIKDDMLYAKKKFKSILQKKVR